MKNRYFVTALAFCCLSGSVIGQEMPLAVMSPETTYIDGSMMYMGSNSYQIWGSAEYLLWWTKSNQLSSPLVSTTNNPFVVDANGNNVAAGIGRPGTSILLGGGDINNGALSGAKFVLGGWLDSDNTLGVEARGFFLPNAGFQRTFASGANGTPVVGIPVNSPFTFGNPILTVPAGENAVVESFPGTFTGSDTVIAHSQLWGTEINGVWNLTRDSTRSIDLIVGFRYANLTEDLSLIGSSTNTLSVANGGGVGFLNNFFDGTVTSTDSWRTRNQFYGGQFGFKMNRNFDRAFFAVDAQIALGSTNQQLDINGSSTLLTAAGVSQVSGGTLNTQNNIGSYSRSQFSVIPEIELKLGYRVSDRMLAFIGYDFFYWTNVARVGEQVDRTVDLRQVPTIPVFDPTQRNTLPAPQIQNSNYWGQGINFGVQFRF